MDLRWNVEFAANDNTTCRVSEGHRPTSELYVTDGRVYSRFGRWGRSYYGYYWGRADYGNGQLSWSTDGYVFGYYDNHYFYYGSASY